MKDNHKADISHTDEFNRMYQELVKQAEDKYKVKSEHLKTEDEMSLDKAGQITDFEYEGLAYTLPEGYQFVDENGNVINATKIVLEKKKKEYPKTYKECCKVLGIEGGRLMFNTKDITEYEENLIYKIGKLEHIKVCRDAYWKLYGEEMGLGKPWELSIGTPIYYIYYNRTVGTIKNDYADDIQGNIILAFPTPEMRDAFYENFKELINECKELL